MKNIWNAIPTEAAVVLVLGLLLAAAVPAVLDFLRRPDSVKLALVQEWLLWAVARAEIALGSGTGEKKLNMVYCWFEVRFPLLCKLISFEDFRGMVDEALDQLFLILEHDTIAVMLNTEEVKHNEQTPRQL